MACGCVVIVAAVACGAARTVWQEWSWAAQAASLAFFSCVAPEAEE